MLRKDQGKGSSICGTPFIRCTQEHEAVQPNRVKEVTDAVFFHEFMLYSIVYPLFVVSTSVLDSQYEQRA
jgi:hypothetical protein